MVQLGLRIGPIQCMGANENFRSVNISTFFLHILVITYYSLQFLSNGDTKQVLQYLFLPSWSISYSKIVSFPTWHLTYTLVMGGAYPYMDLNAKYKKLL